MRREILIVLGITTIVVVLVLVLGPQLSSRPDTPVSLGVKEAGSFAAAPGPVSPNPEPQVRPNTASIRLRPVGALSGELLRDSRAEVLSWLDDRVLARNYSDVAEPGIELSCEAGPVWVKVITSSHDPWHSGRLDLVPGSTRELGDVSVLPTFRVQILPEAHSFKTTKLVITRVWPPPKPPETQPASFGTFLMAGYEVHLSPGKYVCRHPLPYAHPYNTSSGDAGLGYDPTYEFEVVDKPITLTPQFSLTGPLSLQIRLRNLGGEVPRAAWVWAVAHRPPLPDCIVAAALTDRDGVATLTGLRPGAIALVAGREEFADIPSGIVQMDLAPNTQPEPVQLAIREYAWDGKDTKQTEGRLEVQITKHGKPLAGVSLIDRDTDWTQPAKKSDLSDDDGRVALYSLTGQRYFRLNLGTQRVFKFLIRPGETTTGAIELCPEGTTILRGHFDIERGRIESVTLSGIGNSFQEVLVEFDVDTESRFVIWDATPEVLLFEAVIDRGHHLSFGIDVPAQPEFYWKSDLEPQTVKVPPPPWEASVLQVYYSLLMLDRGREIDQGAWFVSGRELTVERVRPGKYRLRVWRGDVETREEWTSEAFTVGEEPPAVDTWSRTRSWERFHKPNGPERSVKIDAASLVLVTPPWRGRTPLNVSWPLDERTEFGVDNNSIWMRVHTAESTIDVSVPTTADWVEVKTDDVRPIRFAIPSGTEQPLALPPLRSRLISLTTDAVLLDMAGAFWQMRLGFDGDASKALGPLQSPESRSCSAETIGATLVMWQGRLALWLPDVPEGAKTLNIRVSGFDEVSIELAADILGYREHECQLTLSE